MAKKSEAIASTVESTGTDCAVRGIAEEGKEGEERDRTQKNEGRRERVCEWRRVETRARSSSHMNTMSVVSPHRPSLQVGNNAGSNATPTALSRVSIGSLMDICEARGAVE